MQVPRLRLTRRGGLAAAATAVAIGVGGWAFAEGEVPLLSPSSSESTTSTTAIGVQAGGGDNVAAAVNTHDGKTVVALAIKITQTQADTVDPVNAAVAVASCTDCQTVAIALEGVLVIGDPATFSPTNLALAMNIDCTNCQTLAAAYQTVVQNDTRVRITGSGRQQIAEIRQDLNSLRNADLDIFVIRQRVNDAAARFTAVLQNEVVPIGQPQEATAGSSTTVAPSPASSTTTPPSTSDSTTSTSVVTTSSSTTSTTTAP